MTEHKPKRVRGPAKKPRKVHASIRMDADIYANLLESYGSSWRMHINKVLSKGLGLESDAEVAAKQSP